MTQGAQRDGGDTGTGTGGQHTLSLVCGQHHQRVRGVRGSGKLWIFRLCGLIHFTTIKERLPQSFLCGPRPLDLPTSWTSLDTRQWPPATRPHHRANLATRMLTAHPSPMPPARPCHRFARRPACLSCTAHRCHRLLQLRRQVHAPQAGWRARRRRPLVGATITSPMDQ